MAEYRLINIETGEIIEEFNQRERKAALRVALANVTTHRRRFVAEEPVQRPAADGEQLCFELFGEVGESR
jgi:hypothetical protein